MAGNHHKKAKLLRINKVKKHLKAQFLVLKVNNLMYSSIAIYYHFSAFVAGFLPVLRKF